MGAGDAEDDVVADDRCPRVRLGGQGRADPGVPLLGDMGDLAGGREGQVGGAVGFEGDVLRCLSLGEVEVGDDTRTGHGHLAARRGCRGQQGDDGGGRGDTGQIGKSGHASLLGRARSAGCDAHEHDGASVEGGGRHGRAFARTAHGMRPVEFPAGTRSGRGDETAPLPDLPRRTARAHPRSERAVAVETEQRNRDGAARRRSAVREELGITPGTLGPHARVRGTSAPALTLCGRAHGHPAGALRI